MQNQNFESISDTRNKLNEGLVLKQDLNSFLDLRKPSTFLFSMSSDAMEKDGILKGDIVVCRRDLVPADGDIILVSLNGSFYIRIFCDGDDPVLTCSNEAVSDIHINFSPFRRKESLSQAPFRFFVFHPHSSAWQKNYSGQPHEKNIEKSKNMI